MLVSAKARNAYVREGHLTLFRCAAACFLRGWDTGDAPPSTPPPHWHQASHSHTHPSPHRLNRYLPLTMEAAFQSHLSEVLPAILDGLSDEAEGVRDAALAAARAFVEIYARRCACGLCRAACPPQGALPMLANCAAGCSGCSRQPATPAQPHSCLPLLLPAVEAGLGHEAWRIRQASVELCGELLFKVAGTSGKVKLDGGSDDEGAASEAHGQAILQALGRQRRDEVRAVLGRSAVHCCRVVPRLAATSAGAGCPNVPDHLLPHPNKNQVLSKLYVTRSDVQYAVRNGALHNWKTLVVRSGLHPLAVAV